MRRIAIALAAALAFLLPIGADLGHVHTNSSSHSNIDWD